MTKTFDKIQHSPANPFVRRVIVPPKLKEPTPESPVDPETEARLIEKAERKRQRRQERNKARSDEL